MNGRLAMALALAALTSAAQAGIHTSSSFTITIGHRPPPRVVVVEREAPRRVVYVERRRECRPAKVVVIRGRDHGRRHVWMRHGRHGHFDREETWYDGRPSERMERETPEQELSSSEGDDDRAVDQETRPINR